MAAKYHGAGARAYVGDRRVAASNNVIAARIIARLNVCLFIAKYLAHSHVIATRDARKTTKCATLKRVRQLRSNIFHEVVVARRLLLRLYQPLNNRAWQQ